MPFEYVSSFGTHPLRIRAKLEMKTYSDMLYMPTREIRDSGAIEFRTHLLWIRDKLEMKTYFDMFYMPTCEIRDSDAIRVCFKFLDTSFMDSCSNPRVSFIYLQVNLTSDVILIYFEIHGSSIMDMAFFCAFYASSKIKALLE